MKISLTVLLILSGLISTPSWAEETDNSRKGVATVYKSRDNTSALVVTGDAAKALYESLTRAKTLPDMGDEGWDASQRLGEHISCTVAKQRKPGAKTEYECLIKFNSKGTAQKAIPG
ncbi:hypothetical protein D3C87_571720 [compost metagenome]